LGAKSSLALIGLPNTMNLMYRRTMAFLACSGPAFAQAISSLPQLK